jgi:hypothetical protein
LEGVKDGSGGWVCGEVTWSGWVGWRWNEMVWVVGVRWFGWNTMEIMGFLTGPLSMLLSRYLAGKLKF